MRSLPAVGQTDELERLADAGLELLARQPVELAEEGQVLHRGEVGVEGQVLGDVADRRLRLERAALEAVDGDLSLVGDGQPAQHGDGGGLPGAVRARAGRSTRCSAMEKDTPVDGQPVAVALAQALAAQHGGWSSLGAPVLLPPTACCMHPPQGKQFEREQRTLFSAR